MTDNVNHPKHYVANGIETIDVIEAWLSPEEARGYLLGNVVKYVSRRAKKGEELEDLRKARWYIARAIATMEREVAHEETHGWVPVEKTMVRCVDNDAAPQLTVGREYLVRRVESGTRFCFVYVHAHDDDFLHKTPFKSTRFEPA